MVRRVLLLDDDSKTRDALACLISSLGHEPAPATDTNNALAWLDNDAFDACVVAFESDGLTVFEAAQQRSPAIPVLILVRDGSVKEVVAALRAGAADFVSKPFHEEALTSAVTRIVGDKLTKTESPVQRALRAGAVIGEHPAMRLMLERINQVADTDANVLIHGEAGTGTDVLARLIHASSARRARPFVAVNVTGWPEALVESELFGALEGTFTGPEQPLAGKIFSAQQGTLFLDEVGEIPLGTQDRLLRVLRERQVVASGSDRPIPINVRIIAGSSRSLESMLRDGSFREELYYRLNVIPVEVPAIRQRKEDVALLADHFVREASRHDGRPCAAIAPEAMRRLCAHDWPDNLPQLASTMERALEVGDGQLIGLNDLPANLRTDVAHLGGIMNLPPYGVDLRLLLNQLEDRLIGQALQRTGGNKNRAAELLGLNRTTLVEKLRRRNVA